MITRRRVSLAGSLLFTTALAAGASDVQCEY